MNFRDLMPWGRRGREAGSAAYDNVKGLVASMERAFEEPWELTSARILGAEWTPRLDVSETPKDVVVSVAIPGIEKDDLHVSATEDTLTIRGVKKEAQAFETAEKGGKDGENEGEDQTVAHAVRSFYRSISLPATIRPDDVKAHFKGGTLTITLPKAKHSQVRRVHIQ